MRLFQGRDPHSSPEAVRRGGSDIFSSSSSQAQEPVRVFSWSALAGYIGIVVAATWPLILHLRTHLLVFLAGALDLHHLLWLNWLIKDSILHHRPFNFTNLIFYPYGRDVLLEFGNYFDSLVTVPFQILFPFPIYFNVMSLVILILDGFAAYLFIRYLVRDGRIAFVCGAFLVLNTYLFHKITLGQMPQTIIFWIPLYMLVLYRLWDRRRWPDAVWVGLIMAMACTTYWYYGFFLMFITLFFLLDRIFGSRWMVPGLVWLGLLFYLFKTPGLLPLGIVAGLATLVGLVWLYRRVPARFRHADFWPPFALAIGVFLVAVMPTAYYYLKVVVDHFIFGRPLSGEVLNLLPSAGVWTPSYGVVTHSMEATYPFFMYPLMLALAFGPWLIRGGRPGRGQWPWLWILVLVFFYLFSLGPFLKLGVPDLAPGSGKIPLIYIFFAKYVPFFSRFHWPERCMAFVLLALAVISAQNLDRMRRRWEIPPWLGWGAVAGTAVLGWALLGNYVLVPGTHPQPIPAGVRLALPLVMIGLAWAALAWRARRGSTDCWKQFALAGLLIMGLAAQVNYMSYRFYENVGLPPPLGPNQKTPSFYYQLAREPFCAIIELPIYHSQNTLLYQIIHRKPMLGGPREADMMTDEYEAFLKGNSFLMYLDELYMAEPRDPPPYYKLQDLDQLREKQFKYIIVQLRNCGSGPMPEPGQPLPDFQRERYERYLHHLKNIFGAAVYQDDLISVFRIR